MNPVLVAIVFVGVVVVVGLVLGRAFRLRIPTPWGTLRFKASAAPASGMQVGDVDGGRDVKTEGPLRAGDITAARDVFLKAAPPPGDQPPKA